MAHWHDFNPWADRIIYVPDLEELADCLVYSKERQLTDWQSLGRIDAYILPSPSGQHSAGIRYGAEGSEYLSLYVNYNRVQELVLKYGPKAPPEREPDYNDDESADIRYRTDMKAAGRGHLLS